MTAPHPVPLDAHDWGWRHASRLRWAVRGVSFHIDPGERVLLLGASGAGKSTLLHGLAGVLGGAEEGDAEGRLLVGGADAVAARGRAGLVLQDPDAQVILARVGDDVAFGCENLGVPREEIWRRVDRALADVDLRVPLETPTKTLSGGQKQRLALAGVIAMRPGVVLLDEPTANLDPAGVREVTEAVRRVLEDTGATFVVVEHRLEAWLDLITRVIVLGEGGVVADGAPEAVFAAHGAALAAAGTWVPGHPPALPSLPATAPGAAMLTASRLAVGRVRGVAVASSIDLEIPAGSVTAITGPNGAGKSTLGLTLAGLLPPLAGEVRAAPSLAAGAGMLPIGWRSRELLTRIGTVFQEPEHQLLRSTVRAELEVGPRALQLSEADRTARVDELLARLRLDALAEANPYTLSGGEKRRLTVGAMLATRPAVLVLDEPTFGQDARTWAELVGLLAGLRDEGAALVAITHDEDVVRALHATRFALGGTP